jgi:flagellar export protein FliJ
MSGKGFRYALEPLRLSRSWAVDDLLAELAGQNKRVAEQRDELNTLSEQLLQARRDWLAGQASGVALALERMALLSRYLQHGTNRQAGMQRQLDALEAERDDIAERLTAARRALDAVEEHRDEQQLAFRRERAGVDLKEADEHWNVLHGREREHDIDG